MITKAMAERADMLPREPRCRVCRHPEVRRLVNQLLDWRGVPVRLEGGKTHKITYADILRDLEPLNEIRDKRDRITYDSLWNHAQRHHNLAGITDYWTAQIDKKLRKAWGITSVELLKFAAHKSH